MRRRGRLRHPAHRPFRNFCRVAGPLMLVGAVLLILTALAGGQGRLLLVFVGIPILMGGILLTRFGFLGATARYVAGEMAPVATDTINYVARGAKEGVREIVEAVRGGTSRGTVLRCHKCNAENDGDAKFCKSCGAALSKSVPCPDCNELNDPDANFCDNCGRSLAKDR